MKNIKLKATELFKKASEFLKKYPFWAGLVIGVVVISVIVAIILSLSQGSPKKDDESSSHSESVSEEVSNVKESSLEWGEGITSDIPQFSGKADSFDQNDSYASAYYSDVTIEQANEYAEKLQEELNVTFSYSDKFPRSAIYGEKIIVIHYNVTEMKLSVTVVKS